MAALTYNGAFEAELRKLMASAKLSLYEEMASGLPLEAYWTRVGQVRAINHLEEICDDVRTLLDER